MARIVMAYIVIADIVLADKVMTYVVTAYIVIAFDSYGLYGYDGGHDADDTADQQHVGNTGHKAEYLGST